MIVIGQKWMRTDMSKCFIPALRKRKGFDINTVMSQLSTVWYAALCLASRRSVTVLTALFNSPCRQYFPAPRWLINLEKDRKSTATRLALIILCISPPDYFFWGYHGGRGCMSRNQTQLAENIKKKHQERSHENSEWHVGESRVNNFKFRKANVIQQRGTWPDRTCY